MYYRFMNSEFIELYFLDEGVFRKLTFHQLLFSGLLNPEA